MNQTALLNKKQKTPTKEWWYKFATKKYNVSNMQLLKSCEYNIPNKTVPGMDISHMCLE